MTSYVNEHPGGDSILNNAGGENTEGFYGSESLSSNLFFEASSFPAVHVVIA